MLEAYLEDTRPTLDEICEEQEECTEECPAWIFCNTGRSVNNDT